MHDFVERMLWSLKMTEGLLSFRHRIL